MGSIVLWLDGLHGPRHALHGCSPMAIPEIFTFCINATIHPAATQIISFSVHMRTTWRTKSSRAVRQGRLMYLVLWMLYRCATENSRMKTFARPISGIKPETRCESLVDHLAFLTRR